MDKLGKNLKCIAQVGTSQDLAAFERLKPGFTRLSLPWFAPNEEIEYILAAIEEIAVNGWKLLPQYVFNPTTGSWQHYLHNVKVTRKWQVVQQELQIKQFAISIMLQVEQH